MSNKIICLQKRATWQKNLTIRVSGKPRDVRLICMRHSLSTAMVGSLFYEGI